MDAIVSSIARSALLTYSRIRLDRHPGHIPQRWKAQIKPHRGVWGQSPPTEPGGQSPPTGYRGQSPPSGKRKKIPSERELLYSHGVTEKRLLKTLKLL